MEPVPMMHHPKKGAVSGDVTLASKPGEEPPAPPPPQPPPMAPQVTRDCLDMMFTYMNYDLFIAKAFYFFFFSAFGSLFPLIAVYFKQLGLNATQSGLLIGLRPFIEFFSAPFWGNIADRFKKAKLILLFSLFCWILFTLSLAFVKPPAHSCIVRNATHTVLEAPRLKRSADSEWEIYENESPALNQRFKRQAFDKTVGQSPYNLDHEDYDNRGEGQTAGLVTPPFSSIVYESKAVQETFALLLLLVIIGEFFAAPAITLADAAVLGYLGNDCGNYGKQRMFGSLGWGLAMFFVGIALDHSTNFPGHPCPVQSPREKNYTICFAVFSVLMAFAWLAATQFHLQLDTDFVDTIPLGDFVRKLRNRFLGIQEPEPQKDEQEEKPKAPVKDAITLDKNDRLQISLDAEKDMVTDAVAHKEEPSVHAETAQRWISVIKLFANVHYGSFLFVSWFMGFGIGLVFTFLFWHLQDLGGSPTLFGIASVINHISEIVAYFFSNKLMANLGHVRVLYIGLGGNVVRFLYISWLRNPWWVLPFEFVQGLTHAAVWAACCSYITQATPASKRSSAQGVLQGIHHGLGRGCGAIFGGVFVYSFGSELTFRGYGFTSMIIMSIFVGLNHFFPKPEIKGADEGDGVPGLMFEESTALAPCGVPMNPLGSSLSNSRLSDVDRGISPAYGAMKSTDKHLMPGNVNGAIPATQDADRDSKNPFITPSRPYDQSTGFAGRPDQPDFNQGYQQQPPQGHRRQQSGGGEVREQPGYGYSVSKQNQPPPSADQGYGFNQPQPQQPQQQQQPREGYGYGQAANQARRDSRENREVAKPRRQDSTGRTAGYEQGYMDSYNQQPNIAPAQTARPRRVSGSRGEEDFGYDGRRQPAESVDYPTRDIGRDETDFVRYDRMKDDPRQAGRGQPETADRYRRDDAVGYPRPEPESKYPRRDDEGGRYPPRRQDSDQGRSPRGQQMRHDSGDYSMPVQTDPQTGRPVIPKGGFMSGGRSGASTGGY